jgi:Fis family transcriptional regulator
MGTEGNMDNEQIGRRLQNTIQLCILCGIPYERAVKELKKLFIIQVLKDHKGNQCHAAKELRMHRNTLGRNIQELEIDLSDIPGSARYAKKKVKPAKNRKKPVSAVGTGLLTYTA